MQSLPQRESLSSPQKNQVFILDIDSTLVSTHQRNQAILEEWIKLHQDKFPDDSQSFLKAQCQFGDYGYKQALERIEFQEQNSGSKENLQTFWRTHFFTNEYLHFDQPIKGAVEWVQSLQEKNITFFYLTARHKNTMWEGTLSSLTKLGFPISSENLFLKENLNDTDEDYKANIFEKFVQKFQPRNLWLIDNEPVVLNKINEYFPEVRLVFFDSTHSGKMQAPDKSLKINNFIF